jgi:hypothetical protein
MFYKKKNKLKLKYSQGIVRDFKGYQENIIYRSPEYENIITIKAYLGPQGFKSHPDFFDIMTKDGKNFYICKKQGLILLNI